MAVLISGFGKPVPQGFGFRVLGSGLIGFIGFMGFMEFMGFIGFIGFIRFTGCILGFIGFGFQGSGDRTRQLRFMAAISGLSVTACSCPNPREVAYLVR